MSLFGRHDAPAAPLTRAERDERDRKAALAEQRALAAHERAIHADLQARALVTAEPLPLDAARASLLTALDDAVQQGAAALRAQLDDAALGYLSDLLTVDYQRGVDALRRAVASFRPSPPLNAQDCDQLATALRAEVAMRVTEAVQQAMEARTLATARASKWLTDWTRQARRIPTDEALADKRDDAAFNHATADERPDYDATHDATHDTEEVLDIATGKTRTIHTFRYAVPRVED